MSNQTRGECCKCHLQITDDDQVVFFSLGVTEKHAHQKCVSDEESDFAEDLGFTVEFGTGREIEDEYNG